MDLRLNKETANEKSYAPYAGYQFEIQLRTIIQDSWSVLDHKIKYKKSIPVMLRRRINTLSALFELADREFKEIRDSTQQFEDQAVQHPESHPLKSHNDRSPQEGLKQKNLNAFSFLKIATHWFRGYDFEPTIVDNFVLEIIRVEPAYQKTDLHRAIHVYRNTIIKYKTELAATKKEKFNPFTLIRHCLYLSDKEKFKNVLTDDSRTYFEDWITKKV